LHDCYHRGIDEPGHTQDAEEVDARDDATGIECCRQRGLKCRIGRADHGAVSACNADDTGVQAAVVEEMPDGIAQQRARIDAIIALVIGEALKPQRLVGRAVRRPADKQRDRRCDAGNGLCAGWKFLDRNSPFRR
jgi:hypothetical protein